MSHYKTVVNLEWTNACNARCSMCPRSLMPRTENMTREIFEKVLGRLKPEEVFRVVVAGYGEPAIHPKFDVFVEMAADHPVRFDIVSNGHALNRDKLRMIDGAIDLLIISFSSINPEIYKQVHVGLDHERVLKNILLAGGTLNKTKLAISLTPTTKCLETLPDTIEWFQDNGIELLTMSPTLYNRAGSLDVEKQAGVYLRNIIKEYGLRSQELEFIPSIWDNLKQIYFNKYNCVPRNVVVPIAANGAYQYCFNDISRMPCLGHVNDMSIAEFLHIREKASADERICADCNIRQRYGFAEIARVLAHYYTQNSKSSWG